MRMSMNLIPSVFLPNKHKEIWLWPSCNPSTKTLSFRDGSVYFDPKDQSLAEPEVELDSCFTNSSELVSVSTESDKYFDTNECSSMEVETIVRGARSDRLFFEPDSTSCIFTAVEESGGGLPYKESVAMVVESENPSDDFKKSMEEMVEIHELKDWDCLEELLRWYLRMNRKNNHEFIVGAFVDLLAGISGGGGGGGSHSHSHHSNASYSSAASTFSSPISSPSSQVGRDQKMMEVEEEEGKTKTGN